MKYRIAADIGGTFTDFVIQEYESKKTFTSKVLSTPKNPAIAVMNGINKFKLDLKIFNILQLLLLQETWLIWRVFIL